jgi:Fe-S-cluster containining protein
MAPARKAARTGTQAASAFSSHSGLAEAEAVNMQTIVSNWKANAEGHDYRNFKFLRSLKWKCEREVDQAARQHHDKAFAIIDCIKCANCCKTRTPVFLAKDIRRIAGHLGITGADFTARYLRRDEEGGLCAKSLPCSFLADDGRCKIYEVRPRDCTEYPHTRKRGFASRTHLHAGNALSCPAVFWIIEQLCARRLP